MAQNGVGAVLEELERWNEAATMDPDKGGGEKPTGSSLGSWVLELCLGREKAGCLPVWM
jgi:hypothetical protein